MRFEPQFKSIPIQCSPEGIRIKYFKKVEAVMPYTEADEVEIPKRNVFGTKDIYDGGVGVNLAFTKTSNPINLRRVLLSHNF